ncbi:MAG: hypothetical protein SNH27_14065, partial [Rikenellaceae bacterium]
NCSQDKGYLLICQIQRILTKIAEIQLFIMNLFTYEKAPAALMVFSPSNLIQGFFSKKQYAIILSTIL